MPNEVNTLIHRDLVKRFDEAEGAVMVSYEGLTVQEDSNLRDSLAAKGVEFQMVRNSLVKRIMTERGYAFPDDVFVGNTAIAWGDAESTIGAAKVFADKDLKKAGKVTVKAGLFEGDCLGKSETMALAAIPDKDTLRAMILGALSGPSRSLVQVLAGVPGGLARVVQAHVDAGESSEE